MMDLLQEVIEVPKLLLVKILLLLQSTKGSASEIFTPGYASTFEVQSNLCTTTTLGTPNLWPLLTGGRCSEVALCNKNRKWDTKIVVAVDKWSLFGGGR